MKKRSVPRDLKHIRLYDWMLSSPAYRSLSVYARCLYTEIRRRYNGSNNGAISMAFREAMELVGCSNRPLLAAFAELQEKGFVRAVQKGAFDWKTRADGKSRATTWLITEFKADHPTPSITAAKDFMRWSAIKSKEKARCDESTPMVCGEHTADRQMVCGEHTKRVTTAHHKGPDRLSDGVTRAHTYNTPLGVGGREDADAA
ncbi:hypothetical protein [Antarcticirhabdus aurantiaca]|uniref:Uncharacterized protein n=1 Tax=Antarcticirhabdus aurantiaca TaxID=2606717 RepID=A0ACD4NW25_9HYPH|nr:hypothetical protein OXU80_12485 [Jeongeuplla avenae]